MNEQRIYEDTFKIFYDPYGGTTYGIIFDPTLKVPRPFRVRGGFNSAPLVKVGLHLLFPARKCNVLTKRITGGWQGEGEREGSCDAERRRHLEGDTKDG